VPPRQPILRLPGRTVVLSEGTVVTSEHLRRDRSLDEPVALVEAHPDRPGSVVLRNLSSLTWSVAPEAEMPKSVAPSQRLGVRPMRIDFGDVGAEIAG
jgi:hypothetical protein